MQNTSVGKAIASMVLGIVSVSIFHVFFLSCLYVWIMLELS